MFDKSVVKKVGDNALEYLSEAHELWRGGLAGFLGFDRKLGVDSYKTHSPGPYRDNTKKPNGHVFGQVTSAACHAYLKYAPVGSIYVNAMRPTYSAGNEEFLLWVAQESPYAKGVLNKMNVDQLLTGGMVIDRSLIGLRGCYWLCKAARYTVEDIWRPGLWKTLVDGGLDPLMAFVGCSILDKTGDKYTRTHNSLLGYGPKAQLASTYNRFLAAAFEEDTEASGPTGAYDTPSWGSLTGSYVDKPDGWGGSSQVLVPGDSKDFIKKLKEIQEGRF